MECYPKKKNIIIIYCNLIRFIYNDTDMLYSWGLFFPNWSDSLKTYGNLHNYCNLSISERSRSFVNYY